MQLASLALGLLVLAYSNSASAIHAYRTQECRAGSLQLTYDGNYAFGGDYSIGLRGQDREKRLLAVDLEGIDFPNEEAAIFFSEGKRTITKPSIMRVEGPFDHEEHFFTAVITFSKVTALATKQLGINEGQKIKFKCIETYDIPNGNDI